MAVAVVVAMVRVVVIVAVRDRMGGGDHVLCANARAFKPILAPGAIPHDGASQKLANFTHAIGFLAVDPVKRPREPLLDLLLKLLGFEPH